MADLTNEELGEWRGYIASTCGHTVLDSDGIEEPCDRPTTGARWYQDVEHEDLLSGACEIHKNEGGRRMLALLDEVEHLRRWKSEALPVMSGLQELGRALGVRPGKRITGRAAVDAALDLQNERDDALARVEAAKAEALREAADALGTTDRRGVPNETVVSIRRWLRTRAEALSGDEARGGKRGGEHG